MKNCLLIICCLLFGWASSTQAADKPNVLVILADDLGFSDLGCYGSEIETPNLDRLADNGLRFTQFYNTARCWPTRAALLTGYYAQQVGRDAFPGKKRPGTRPAWARLLPDMLRPLGYRSYHSGKWHIDGKPIEHGFDLSYLLQDQGRFFNPKVHYENDEKLPAVKPGTDYYGTIAIADHAIRCLEGHAKNHTNAPFFHYLAFTAPHFPLHALPEDIAKYKDRYHEGWEEVRKQRWQRIQEIGLVDDQLSDVEREVGPPYDFPEAIKALGPGEINRPVPWDDLTDEQREFQAAKMAIHAAMIDRMDQEIGRVLEQLQKMGQLNNTLIMFLSDNGASAEIMVRDDGHDPNAPLGSAATYPCLGPGWSTTCNTPFRRHKTWVHEGGIATPLIVHWPNKINAAGELRHGSGHVTDIVPTILEIADGQPFETWEGKPVPSPPGTSLMPIFASDTITSRSDIWWLHESNRAIRQGDWKLVAARDQPWELFNLSEDRAETNNLADQYSEKVKQLSELWVQRTQEIREAALTKKQVESSLRRGVEFFREQVSTNGGYLWRYAADLTEREGELPASPTTAWVQPPGTPTVGMAYLKAYELTGDKKILDATRETALALVSGQLESGGWDYRIEFDEADRENYQYLSNAISRPARDPNKKKPRNISTLDDNTTQAALSFLMHTDKTLDFKDPVIHESAQFALQSLLAAQYPNGAWPQRFVGPPDPGKFPVLPASYPTYWSRKYPATGYLDFYTFNDNAIADTIELLFLASEIYEDEKYAAAAKKAGDFILLAQMPEPQPGWAQQYNANMHPAWARKFEPPGITGAESQAVMETLLRIYQFTGDKKYLAPLPRALAYFRRSQLDNGQLARFYEMKTNRPIFFTKDYFFTYSDTDLPTHYGFKATSRLDAIEAEYQRLADQDPADFQAIRILQPRQQPKMTDKLTAATARIVAEQDTRGAWVEPAHYRNRTKIATGSPSINSRTFARNLVTLAKYISASKN